MSFEDTPIIDVEIDLQCANADSFIGDVESRIEQAHESEFPHTPEEGYLQLHVRMAEIVERYHKSDTVEERLLAAEDLSDFIIKAITEDYTLDPHSPAADAQLIFREPLPDKSDSCVDCQNLPPVFSREGGEDVCVRCFFTVE